MMQFGAYERVWQKEKAAFLEFLLKYPGHLEQQLCLVTAGKWIVIMLWKLKTVLAVTQWPTCSGSPRQKWLSYSFVLRFDVQKYELEECERLRDMRQRNSPREHNQNFLSSLFSLSVLTRIGHFPITVLTLANNGVGLLMLTLTGKALDAQNFMNTRFFGII